MSGTEGHESVGESELVLSSKAEEIVDKKVTQRQLYGSSLDISEATKCRLRRRSVPTKMGNTTDLFHHPKRHHPSDHTDSNAGPC